MSGHLPWINHLAAREAGRTLIEFAALPADEQAEWIRFTLHGPSRLRDTLMLAEIRNMIRDFMTGSKTLTPVDDDWIKGILEHPDEAWSRQLREAAAKRKASRIAAARALYDRERQAEGGGTQER